MKLYQRKRRAIIGYSWEKKIEENEQNKSSDKREEKRKKR